MYNDSVAGLEHYLSKQIEGVQKGIANFRERLETHPVWALEGVEHTMVLYYKEQRAKELLRMCEHFRAMLALPADAEERSKYEKNIGFELDSADVQMQFLNKVEESLLEAIIREVRTGASLSTSPGANLKRDVVQIVNETFRDARKWGQWSRA